MASGEHDGHIADFVISARRDVAGLAVRGSEFAQLASVTPADAGMLAQGFYHRNDQRKGLLHDRCIRFEQKIFQPIKIVECLRCIDKRRHLSDLDRSGDA